MKNYISTVCLALLPVAGMTESRAAEKEPKSISVESLNTIEVIGKLGVPLGKVATIRATVLDGDSLQTKQSSGSYLLKISEVNGKKLDKESIVDFALAPGSDVKLANGDFALYKLKTGKEADSLTSEQIDKLKKDYVGQSFLLQVYELGGFTGIPDDMPNEAGVWQDTGFYFHTYLRVLREVPAK